MRFRILQASSLLQGMSPQPPPPFQTWKYNWDDPIVAAFILPYSEVLGRRFPHWDFWCRINLWFCSITCWCYIQLCWLSSRDTRVGFRNLFSNYQFRGENDLNQVVFNRVQLSSKHFQSFSQYTRIKQRREHKHVAITLFCEPINQERTIETGRQKKFIF